MVPDDCFSRPVFRKLQERPKDDLDFLKNKKKDAESKCNKIKGIKLKRKSVSCKNSPVKKISPVIESKNFELPIADDNYKFDVKSLGNCGMLSDPGSKLSDDEEK